jgi:4-amino-4-deoxy-L-arabinose transferase-like glycosyltransferase
MKIGSKPIGLVIIFTIGFVLRLAFASISAKGIFFDMKNYDDAARTTMAGKIVAECCLKNNGYGVFLALPYLLFGPDNNISIWIIQALLDLGSGLILYSIARSLFSDRAAVIVFLIYCLNPLTSSYVGLRLSEIVTICIISVTAYNISRLSFNTKPLQWLIFGFLSGLLIFVRVQYYNFSTAFLFISAFLFIQKKKIIKYILVSLLGFLLASSYSLISNYQFYRKISLVPPYHGFYGGLYQNFYNTFRYPELLDNFRYVPPEYTNLVVEYFQTPIEGIKAFEDRYKILFAQRIRTDWVLFLKITVQNALWIWDKDHFSAYTDIFYPWDKYPIRIYNILLFTFFIIGILKYGLLHKLKSITNPIFFFTLSLFFYITLLFPLVSNESRHSIPFYPLLYLWAGYGISVLPSYKHLLPRKEI